MLFSGGLIPSYMIVKDTRLLDTIWALILPSAVNVFNIILLLNFFRNIPKELEAAFIDGAGHWTILSKIFIPLSMPALATLIVFTVVGHWNSWFDGMIYMNNPANYPLQTYLETLVVQSNSPIMSKANALLLRVISERTTKSAQIFIATIPIFLIYPLLQKYFMASIVVGSVKG